MSALCIKLVTVFSHAKASNGQQRGAHGLDTASKVSWSCIKRPQKIWQKINKSYLQRSRNNEVFLDYSFGRLPFAQKCIHYLFGMTSFSLFDYNSRVNKLIKKTHGTHFRILHQNLHLDVGRGILYTIIQWKRNILSQMGKAVLTP